ncbi:MAG: molybdopterin cofactor-binding domain-containing protein [Bacillota bacterium]
MQRIMAIGDSLPIRDANMKATGRFRFVGDIKKPNMLHARLLTSPVPHAKIVAIDTSEAEALPGVYAVATFQNTPPSKYNSATRFYEHRLPETEQIFSDTVRFVGDRVAAVAAATPKIAQEAIGKIKVEYSPLPFYTDPISAMQENASPIHPGGNIVATMTEECGNVEEAMEKADFILDGWYHTSPVHHAAIELHVYFAEFDENGVLTITVPHQNTFSVRIILARIFHMPLSKIRILSPAIGGGFGGKLELTHEPVAAQLAMMTGHPVKLALTRRESMLSTYTRHGSAIYIRSGVKRDGELLAQEVKIINNTGAYATSALNVTGTMGHDVFIMYKCRNMRFTGRPVYTNTPVAGAMRGYGSPQIAFAQQRHMQQIANALGLGMADLLMKNLVDPEDANPLYGTPLGNPHPKDCLTRALALKENWKTLDDENGKYRIGVGIAMGCHGNGCFGVHRDQICLMLKMNEDGSCVLFTGTHDMGNGSVTMQLQIVSHELEIPFENIAVVSGDTNACPWNLGDYSSHGVYIGGNAAKKASRALLKQLKDEAAALFGGSPDDYTHGNGHICGHGHTAAYSELAVHAQNTSHRELIVQETYAAMFSPTSYGAHIARVKVEKDTNRVVVTDYIAVHDVGRCINRQLIEGQLHGGILMGMGYALTEQIEVADTGKPLTTSLRNYRIPNSLDMPSIQVDFIEKHEPTGPYGAKGIGEVSTVPGAPAIINAISQAIGRDIVSIPFK